LQSLEPEELEGAKINFPSTVFVSQPHSAGSTMLAIFNESEATIDTLPITPQTSQIQPVKSLEPGFIMRCQQQLAYHIGPIASLIIEEILAETPETSPDEFIELLAREIPDLQAAFEFKQSFFSDY